MRVAGHAAGGPRLAQEAPLIAVALQRAVFDLDRDVAADRVLNGPVDRRITAAGQHGQPGEPGDRGWRLWTRSGHG